MTKYDKTNLTDAVLNCIAELDGPHGYQMHEVTSLVMQRYAKVVEEAQQRLTAEAIANIARSLMTKRPLVDTRQGTLFLPEELKGIELPQMISIPPDGNPESEDEGNFIWINIKLASFKQLRLYMAHLEVNIARCQKRLKNCRRLHDYLAPAMEDGHEDEPFWPVLQAHAPRLEQAA